MHRDSLVCCSDPKIRVSISRAHSCPVVGPIRSKQNDVIEWRKGFGVPIHDFRELGSWNEKGDMIDRHGYLENMATRWSSLEGTDSRSESKD